MIQVLFLENIGTPEHLADIVSGAHGSEVEVWDREHIARARVLVADPAP